VHDELNIKGGGRQKAHAPTVIRTGEEGALFRSYRDGSEILLTPEITVQVQKKLGSDIIIPLDHLPPYHIDPR
jgi:queuine tRNA-ribosyltransferase